MTQPGRPGRPSVTTWGVVAVLLAIGVAGTLVVPLYARAGPKLGPFPFFYWYQLAWIPIVAILGLAAYLLTRAAALVGLPRARLRHARRLCPRPLRPRTWRRSTRRPGSRSAP
jgi:hypothetical protein